MAIAKAKRNRQRDAEITGSLMGDLNRFEVFLVENWKIMIAAGVIGVVAVGIFFSVQAWQNAREGKALNTLSAARTEPALVAALKLYGSEPASREARLRLAHLYLQEAKYDQALEQFALLEKADLPVEMRDRISLDRAYLLEAAGKVQEAADQLDRSCRNTAVSVGLRAEAGYGAGRLYAQLKALDRASASLAAVAGLSRQLAGMPDQEWCRLAAFVERDLKNGFYGKYTPATPAVPAAAR